MPRDSIVKAWASASITPVQYEHGVLSVPGWKDGPAHVRFPDATVAAVEVCNGEALGAQVFVWNWLEPGETLLTLSPTDGGQPGLIRFDPKPVRATTPQRLAGRRDELLEQHDFSSELGRFVETALKWMGSPADFESVWAFLGSRGLRVDASFLAKWISKRFTLYDDGTIWADDPSPQELAEFTQQLGGWDSIEASYWELQGATDPPHIAPVYQKRHSGKLDGLEYLLDDLDHDLLTRAQEAELWRTISAGQEAEELLHSVAHNDWDERERLGWLIREADDARERFARANMRLVFSIARKHAGKIEGTVLDAADLHQYGLIGLLRAIERFDASRGFKFSTYASWWIRQSITRGIADFGRTIRLPVHVVEKVHRLAVARRDLSAGLGRPPTITELAATIGETEGVAIDLTEYSRVPESLDALLSDTQTLGAEAAQEEAGFAEVELGLLNTAIHDALQRLNTRESYVLTMRYGLEGELPRSLAEVAERLDLTRERVRQIQNKGIENLRSEAVRTGLFDWEEGLRPWKEDEHPE